MHDVINGNLQLSASKWWSARSNSAYFSPQHPPSPRPPPRTTISVWMSCFEEMCSRNRMWYRCTETVCRQCVWCCVSAGYNASIVSPFAGAQRRLEQSRLKKDERDEKNSVEEKPTLIPTLLIHLVFPWFPFDQQSTSGRCSPMLRLIQAFLKNLF